MKKILLLATLILTVTDAFSQTVGKCIKGNCEKGNGTLETPNGNQYKGHWENGKINGKGTVTYANGDKYSGELVDGNQNGKGTYLWSNGDKYVGNWKDNLFEGQGEMIYSSGTKTVGEWRGGKVVTRLPNGDVYIGDWKDGKYNGYGILETHGGFRGYNEGTYTGEWKNGERNGRGIQTWLRGNVKFEGEWKDDMLHGKGTFSDEDGNSYSGDYHKGNPHGFGVRKYSNGDVYTGNFAAGMRQGLGKLVTKNGQIKDGYWDANVWFEQAVRLGFNKPVDMSLGSIAGAVAEVASWGASNNNESSSGLCYKEIEDRDPILQCTYCKCPSYKVKCSNGDTHTIYFFLGFESCDCSVRADNESYWQHGGIGYDKRLDTTDKSIAAQKVCGCGK